MDDMTPKPKAKTVAGDRKVTIRPPLIAVVDIMAEMLASDPTAEINRIVCDWLIAERLWPVTADTRKMVGDWIERQRRAASN